MLAEFNHPNISSAEFENPHKMDPELVIGLGLTRDWIKRPMSFTQTVSGTVIHPHGDAVDVWSKSHAKGSLHKYDCEHIRTAEVGSVVRAPGALGLAQDWDCGIKDPEELFDMYLTIERLNYWEGIGLYPHWNRPGFHVDIRSQEHPSARARWFRIKGGTYFPLTWANWKSKVID